MRKSSDIRVEAVLKAILTQVEPVRRKALEELLPEHQRQTLKKLPDASGQINFDASLNFSVLEKVHWSWFLPTLKSHSENEQKLFLSSLNPHAAKNLSRALTLSLNGAHLTEIARSYLRNVLLDSLTGPGHRLLSPEFFAKSPLLRILDLSKKELTRLIDLLSIHDLATEIRQIVDTKTLKKIYSLLSLEEKDLLKKATNKKKEHFHLGKLGLDRWDGSEESLRMHLHRRALQRFGAGLSGEDPDFIWYVCHQLDIGRGTALYKACHKEMIPGVTDVVQKQIEELL